MKKTFALILSIMLGLSSMSGCSTNKSESPENQLKNPAGESAAETTENNNDTAVVDWADIYTKFIIENEADFTEEAQPTIAYIGVNDLNFDGVPELIVSGTVASAAYYFNVFQIQDGAVEKVDFTNNSGDKLSLYSHFIDGWITLRKNANDGSLKYVLLSGNGGSDETFGNLISICQDPNDINNLKITNGFEYIEFWETSDNNEYYVAGNKVSVSEYEALREEFDKTWQDTGIVNCAMIDPTLSELPNIYKNTIPASTDEQDLKNFFDMYQPEK